MVPLHKPSGWKRGQKKRAEMLPLCSRNFKFSKCRQSIAPQNQKVPKWNKKKRAFLKFFLALPQMLTFFEKREKKRWCSFFSVHFLVFFHFLKSEKSGKNRKNIQKIAFFSFFSYALRPFFYSLRVTQNAHKFWKMHVEKKTKKNEKNFFKTFFKNKKLDNYFCPFFKF